MYRKKYHDFSLMIQNRLCTSFT